MAQHLTNHVKKEGFEGDDFVIENQDDLERCLGPQEPDTVLFITKECTGGVTGGSFAIQVSGNSIGTITLGCGATSQAFIVNPGADLTVHETTTGFDTSYRGACDGDGSVILKAGQENTCVVSNAGVTTLTIVKECGEGVTSADGPFNFTLVGSINDTFSIPTCGGEHEVEGVNADDTGVLTETNAAAKGFDVSIRGDCDGDGSLQLIENDNNVCVVHNEAEVGDTTLVITKECTGGVTGGSFNINLSGHDTGSFSLGCGASTAPITIHPTDTDLKVTETTTGFDTSYRGVCDGDGSVVPAGQPGGIQEGEQNTCVVSNAGLITLTITKECGDGVTSDDGPFNFTLTGSINDTFSIATCGGSHEVVGVNEDDTGILAETNTGFDVSIRGDCDGNGTLQLIANDDNVCVVRNEQPGVPPVIIVVPTAVPTSVPPAALVEATAVPTAVPPAAPVEVVEAAPTTVPTTQPAAAVAGVTALPSTGSGGSDEAHSIPLWLLTGLLAGLGGLALLSSRVIRS